jgi:hypothetical protein
MLITRSVSLYFYNDCHYKTKGPFIRRKDGRADSSLPIRYQCSLAKNVKLITQPKSIGGMVGYLFTGLAVEMLAIMPSGMVGEWRLWNLI